MKGHEGIIRMRMNGKKPAIVFIQETMYATDWEQYGDYPTVCIKPDEDLHLLDLRFLVGLAVSVSTSEKNRLNAFQSICKQYCDTVASCLVVQNEGKKTFTTIEGEIWHR